LEKIRCDAQIKEMNAKMEKIEIELREKTQESKIASSKIRELQSSGNGLPVKRERETLKPINHQPGDKSQRLPSVGRSSDKMRKSSAAAVRTMPQSPVRGNENGSKSVLENKSTTERQASNPRGV
jgi:hypothetical protein